MKSTNREVKRKHKVFAETYVAQGKKNARKAYMVAYPDSGPGSAAVNAHKLLKDPRILESIEGIDTELEDTLLDVMRTARTEYKTNKRATHGMLAKDTVAYIHDKRHGKAINRVQTESRHVEITLDLSGN